MLTNEVMNVRVLKHRKVSRKSAREQDQHRHTDITTSDYATTGNKAYTAARANQRKQTAAMLNSAIEVISSAIGVVAPTRTYSSATSRKKPGFCTS